MFSLCRIQIFKLGREKPRLKCNRGASAKALLTRTRMGVNPYRCCGLLGCPKPWRVIEEWLHCKEITSVSCSYLKTYTATSRDFMKMERTIVLHMVSWSPCKANWSCMHLRHMSYLYQCSRYDPSRTAAHRAVNDLAILCGPPAHPVQICLFSACRQIGFIGQSKWSRVSQCLQWSKHIF